MVSQPMYFNCYMCVVIVSTSLRRPIYTRRCDALSISTHQRAAVCWRVASARFARTTPVMFAYARFAPSTPVVGATVDR
jgi:hypothetical protein